MAEKKFLDLNGLLYFWNKVKGYVDTADSNKVDKVSGKQILALYIDTKVL